MKSFGRLLIVLVAAASVGSFCASGIAMDEPQIKQKFADFREAWLKNLSEQGPYGEKNMKVEKDADGGSLFVARYDILKGRSGAFIRKTDQPDVPYVGVIRYEVWTCSASGRTEAEARAGNFECQCTRQNQENFRFNGKDWGY